VNRRKDNHKEDIFRFCVRAIDDLNSKIVPFFKEHPLRTSKKIDFEKFCKVLNMMEKGQHLKSDGKEKVAEICQTMNRKKKSRFLESSETTSQNPPKAGKI